MLVFINMDFDGSQWWVEYNDGGEDKINYYSTEEEAYEFYNTIK